MENNCSRKQPKDRQVMHHIGVFIGLSLTSFSTATLDRLFKTITNKERELSPAEFKICFTDVKSTPDKIIGYLQKKKIPIVQNNNFTSMPICLWDHFWRFPTFDAKKVVCIIAAPENLKVHEHDMVKRLRPIEPDDMELKRTMKEDADKKKNTVLVVTNYFNKKAVDVLAQKVVAAQDETTNVSEGENLLNNGLGQPKTEEISHLKIIEATFSESKYALRFIEKYQSRALQITFTNNNKKRNDAAKKKVQKINTMNQDPSNHLGPVRQLQNGDNEFTVETQDREILTPHFYHEKEIDILVLWDIQNCNLQSSIAKNYIAYIREKYTLLKEHDFICVTDVHKHKDELIKLLCDLGVTVIHEPVAVEQSADTVLIHLMGLFSSNRRNKAKIVLITGDSDFINSVYEVMTIDRNQVCVIYSKKHKKSFSHMLSKIRYEMREQHDEIKHKLQNKMNSKQENDFVGNTGKAPLADNTVEAPITQNNENVPIENNILLNLCRLADKYGELVEIEANKDYVLVCKNTTLAEKALNEVRQNYKCKVLKIDFNLHRLIQ